MDSAVGTEGRRMNRWWRVAGALLMNLPLGALYAWSIFVLPLGSLLLAKRPEVPVAACVEVVKGMTRAT